MQVRRAAGSKCEDAPRANPMSASSSMEGAEACRVIPQVLLYVAV
jgi:hypothetical protein